MYTVELYARVRRAVRVEGKSQRAVAREFGLARKTVRKMLAYTVPPGYQRQQPIRRPKLGPWVGVIVDQGGGFISRNRNKINSHDYCSKVKSATPDTLYEFCLKYLSQALRTCS
jgi:ribosomal protein S14